MIATIEKLHASIIDETGNRYGRLTVLGPGPKCRQGRSWLVRCECGSEKAVMGGSLRSGTTKSCGCLARELQTLPEGESAFNQYYSGRKLQSENRGRAFELTKRQVRNISAQNCHYCGAPPANVIETHAGNGTFTYNGMDRVNSKLGYLVTNVVPSCKFCNFAKHNQTTDEFKSWLTRAYKHFVEGQSQ